MLAKKDNRSLSWDIGMGWKGNHELKMGTACGRESGRKKERGEMVWGGRALVCVFKRGFWVGPENGFFREQEGELRLIATRAGSEARFVASVWAERAQPSFGLVINGEVNRAQTERESARGFF
jgi:hypothetical protein